MRQLGAVLVGADDEKEVWEAWPATEAEQVATKSLRSSRNGKSSPVMPCRAILLNICFSVTSAFGIPTDIV